MTTYQRATELMEADVGGELVALQPDLGVCFGFNDVATQVWKLLDAPKSFEQLKQHLLASYDVEDLRCSTELEELLEQMTQHGLIARKAD